MPVSGPGNVNQTGMPSKNATLSPNGTVKGSPNETFGIDKEIMNPAFPGNDSLPKKQNDPPGKGNDTLSPDKGVVDPLKSGNDTLSPDKGIVDPSKGNDTFSPDKAIFDPSQQPLKSGKGNGTLGPPDKNNTNATKPETNKLSEPTKPVKPVNASSSSSSSSSSAVTPSGSPNGINSSLPDSQKPAGNSSQMFCVCQKKFIIPPDAVQKYRKSNSTLDGPIFVNFTSPSKTLQPGARSLKIPSNKNKKEKADTKNLKKPGKTIDGVRTPK